MTQLSINGAGIAGLAAAIALAQKGFKIDIYEKATGLREGGAGIQLSPNALFCLEKLGVSLICGVEPQRLEIITPHLKLNMPMGKGFLTLRREALQQALYERACKLDVKVHFNISHDTPDLHADGVHSPFREKPKETGIIAFRATLKQNFEPKVQLFLRPKAHLVTYPITKEDLNIVLIGKQDALGLKSWPKEAQALLEGAEFSPYPIFTQPYLEKNCIGDACHAMPPHLGQGAAMALEDAFVLGETFPNWQKFHLQRKARVQRVARYSHLNGMIYRLPFPFSLARDSVMWLLGAKGMRKKQAWLYEFKDATHF